ncbi:MAG: hypothetical protein K5945_06685 [Bacteroidaceae bacterium]|nr:hypothetical protein [Bacteroidaceae bacterium]
MKPSKSLFFALLFAVTPMQLITAQERGVLDHLDLGVTLGTTGIGADIAMPVGDYVRLRTGFTVMPHFTLTSNFGIEMNGMTFNDSQRRRMKDLMRNFTGTEMQDNVDMDMQPTWSNFKFLVDVFPIPNNKHWNVTFGFYAGPSRIGKALNAEDAAPTLAAVNIYNSLYNKACKGESMLQYEDSHGVMHDASLPPGFDDRLISYGMMGMPLGHFADGEKAMMVPNANYSAKAEMCVNKFRPYIGLGYNTSLSPDGKWKLSVDGGVMFWGGKPHVYVDNVYKLKSVEEDDTYYYYDTTWLRKDDYTTFEDVTPQRIDLTRDVSDVRGKVGDMVKMAKKFTCYPMLSITFSRTIF